MLKEIVHAIDYIKNISKKQVNTLEIESLVEKSDINLNDNGLVDIFSCRAATLEF